MKKQKQNSTVNYDPETIGKTLTANFTKTITEGRTIIYGRVMKNGDEVATVSYNSSGDFLITQIKPVSALNETETQALYKAVPGYIAEILAE